MAAVHDVDTGGTFRAVFAIAEFRALWTAQTLSIVGDQLARVALTLLVYDRTRSALLAAITFAASVVPVFLGGIVLAGLADRFPRRLVMIICDLARLVLVVAMTVPRLPVAVLVILLFTVTMFGPLFTSARTTIYADVLPGDRYALGQAITLTTYQLAQVAGFAVGGALVAIVHVRTSLLADAATFGCSALITRIWVHARPAARGAGAAGARPAARGAGAAITTHFASIAAGARLVFRTPGLRTPMLLGWLAAFYNAPEGVAAPLAGSLGGGTAAVGLILAAGALGAAAGGVLFTRLVTPGARLRWMRPLAVASCGALAFFALGPTLPLALAILFTSGLFDCFQVAASSAFVSTAPPEHRSQVFGIAQAGMSLAQGVAMVLAGAAVQAHAPVAAVIAASGVLGAVIAIAIRPGGPPALVGEPDR
jgi:MFS family permease